MILEIVIIYHRIEGSSLLFLPKKRAVVEKYGNCHGFPLPRDVHIREIRKSGQRKWKERKEYHRRSLSERAMYRLRTLLGDKLSSREFHHQTNEAFIKCKILNQMLVPSSLSA